MALILKKKLCIRCSNARFDFATNNPKNGAIAFDAFMCTQKQPHMPRLTGQAQGWVAWNHCLQHHRSWLFP